jgi:hypothetical protein
MTTSPPSVTTTLGAAFQSVDEHLSNVAFRLILANDLCYLWRHIVASFNLRITLFMPRSSSIGVPRNNGVAPAASAPSSLRT